MADAVDEKQTTGKVIQNIEDRRKNLEASSLGRGVVKQIRQRNLSGFSLPHQNCRLVEESTVFRILKESDVQSRILYLVRLPSVNRVKIFLNLQHLNA